MEASCRRYGSLPSGRALRRLLGITGDYGTGVTGVTGSQIFACPDQNLEAASDGTCLNLHWCCPPMQSPAFFVSVATWHQSRGLSAWPRCAHPTPHVKRLQALRDGKRPVENSCRDTTHIIYQQLHACAFLIPFFESCFGRPTIVQFGAL